jgi:hypothetical protein
LRGVRAGSNAEAFGSYHVVMPLWRCPHCGTPQAETARCWVCHRSSTSCGTCRHFRISVANGLGYCGLDRQRTPLDGSELRACWQDPSMPDAMLAEQPFGQLGDGLGLGLGGFGVGDGLGLGGFGVGDGLGGGEGLGLGEGLGEGEGSGPFETV